MASADELLESAQEKQVRDIFKSLTSGFQKLDKMKDPARQSRLLEELTAKMRECKSLIKEFDREIKTAEPNNPDVVNKQLNDRKQSLIKELNSFVALRKTYTSTLAKGGDGEIKADEGPKKASMMNNQQLMDAGKSTMDETDQAIGRTKKVVEDTINVGAQTATTLKGQTEQMGRIVNELDSINFSIKKAAGLVKEIGRQIATDRCILFFLFIIFIGVIVIIIVKIVDPSNKNIANIPGITSSTSTSTSTTTNGGRRLARRLLMHDLDRLHDLDPSLPSSLALAWWY